MAVALKSSCIPPPQATGALVLADGLVMWGLGAGAQGEALGEICFNTSMTGYQEIMTDPSYAGQLICFTFPHIGNIGTNNEDLESVTPAARGCIIKADITEPSNWRSTQHLSEWMKIHKLVALTGLDTRKLTRYIRDKGATNGLLIHTQKRRFDIRNAIEKAASFEGLKGMDLAKEVSCKNSYEWHEGFWSPVKGKTAAPPSQYHVVAIDYGAKHNILRCLAQLRCKITVVPATTDATTILDLKPDGVFLSNGPGDPAATGVYAEPTIKELLYAEKPLFGICLGHQLLARALGAKTEKMHHGHRGANHPVKNTTNGRVEITSQNHGFVVLKDSLPDEVAVSHVSLFDNSLEGIQLKNRPVFSVQYHPEASPGPQDSHYLFQSFIQNIEKASKIRA